MWRASEDPAAKVPGGFGAQPLTRSYRPEIDGLRAVAIVPVVLFHSGLTLFSGGFVGVDVFFVISGYLITQILYKEARAGRFSIARFYARRIRRIFPALFLMLAASAAAGVFLLLPSELTELAKSIMATAIFVSNVLFYFSTDYFASPAIFTPLLHTWSLAVEEQFYIFFPLGLWLVHRWRKEALLPLLAVCAAGSFALNLAMIERAPEATFYMFPTRAWELLVGGIIAISPWQAPLRYRGFLAAIGLLMIIVAVLAFNEATPFPGLAAMLPVAGSALIIFAGEGTTTARVLSLGPVRAVGLISYSLYLWHWPVLSFAHFAYGTVLPPLVTACCIGIALLMAWVSWAFVEAPFRKSGEPGPAIGVGMAAITGMVAVAALLLPGLPARIPATALSVADVGPAPSYEAACFPTRGPNPSNVSGCISGQTVLLGDSHALQFLDAARSRVEGISFLGRGSCLPVVGAEVMRLGRIDQRCAEFNAMAIDAIVADPKVKSVILAGRWARLSFPSNDPESAAAQNDVGAQLRATVARLHRAGKKVMLIGPVPEFTESLPPCLARSIWHGSGARCRHNPLTIDNRKVEGWLLSAGADDVIWPANALCAAGHCLTTMGGRPVARDRNHLTPEASAMVLDRTHFARRINTLNAGGNRPSRRADRMHSPGAAFRKIAPALGSVV